ncbi:hypothetical protein BUALT_Bualt07G0023100 [Buddleja alternifolia]|uniref:MULE transposase domain-containing protein n=1 Tax=Buddleja alternifolia TaxID=168488 RepID=A0AAV6XI31_9LAMI|nr:hypothetical protein BUALT_Bualt07G0023100 [Buddleja alternifolia]
MFYLSDLMNMYVKSGGKCTCVAIYYCLPGHSLDNGIRLLYGDKGVIELIRAYNGKNVIPIYFEEIAAPLLVVDTQGAIINNDESLLALPPPENTNINQPIDLDNEYDGDDENQLNNYNLGAEKEIDNMSTDENFENNEDDDFKNKYLDFAEDLNWENETVENLNNEPEVVENLNNEPEAFENLNNEGENEAAKNLNNAENVNTEFQEGVETSVSEEGENVEGVDAAESEGVHLQEVERPAENVGNQVDPNIESESDASSVSDCPSWICEDLEGPNDDDIITIRPPDHGKKLLKAMRAFLKDQKGKRRAKQQEQFYERNFNNDTEGWCSDVNDDDDLRSLKGSDDYNEVSLKNKIRRDVQIECNLHKVYRDKRYAVELLRGDLKEQYNRLFDYCATVVEHNPNNHLVLKLDKSLNPPVLSRMYCCLSRLRDGFLDGCRPIIGLDGCFLKGLFKGQLLCAVGRDENDNLYLIAWALVEVENFDTWKWFQDLLMRDIGSAEEKGWTFLSDRQKGLIDVVHSVAPRAEHRFCVRHLYKNFKGRFKGEELKKLFWKAASTYSVKQHLRIMKQIERLHPKRGAQQTPYEWMSEIPELH